ncbi:hypothetical protein HDU97_009392 [Phlyctochytrium planicorne]|nr:hypothetical protein HDU97_009392 [Phlyctochytrium planicorne]
MRTPPSQSPIRFQEPSLDATTSINNNTTSISPKLPMGSLKQHRPRLPSIPTPFHAPIHSKKAQQQQQQQQQPAGPPSVHVRWDWNSGLVGATPITTAIQQQQQAEKSLPSPPISDAEDDCTSETDSVPEFDVEMADLEEMKENDMMEVTVVSTKEGHQEGEEENFVDPDELTVLNVPCLKGKRPGKSCLRRRTAGPARKVAGVRMNGRRVQFWQWVDVEFTHSLSVYDRTSIATIPLTKEEARDVVAMRWEMRQVTRELYRQRQALEKLAMTTSSHASDSEDAACPSFASSTSSSSSSASNASDDEEITEDAMERARIKAEMVRRPPTPPIARRMDEDDDEDDDEEMVRRPNASRFGGVGMMAGPFRYNHPQNRHTYPSPTIQPPPRPTTPSFDQPVRTLRKVQSLSSLSSFNNSTHPIIPTRQTSLLHASALRRQTPQEASDLVQAIESSAAAAIASQHHPWWLPDAAPVAPKLPQPPAEKRWGVAVEAGWKVPGPAASSAAVVASQQEEGSSWRAAGSWRREGDDVDLEGGAGAAGPRTRRRGFSLGKVNV